MDSLGWTAEFRIPLSQLRFSRTPVQEWGMQVWRTLARRNETSMWAFWRRNEPGGPGYFGAITDLVTTTPRPAPIARATIRLSMCYSGVSTAGDTTAGTSLPLSAYGCVGNQPLTM